MRYKLVDTQTTDRNNTPAFNQLSAINLPLLACYFGPAQITPSFGKLSVISLFCYNPSTRHHQSNAKRKRLSCSTLRSFTCFVSWSNLCWRAPELVSSHCRESMWADNILEIWVTCNRSQNLFLKKIDLKRKKNKIGLSYTHLSTFVQGQRFTWLISPVSNRQYFKSAIVSQKAQVLVTQTHRRVNVAFLTNQSGEQFIS